MDSLNRHSLYILWQWHGKQPSRQAATSLTKDTCHLYGFSALLICTEICVTPCTYLICVYSIILEQRISGHEGLIYNSPVCEAEIQSAYVYSYTHDVGNMSPFATCRLVKCSPVTQYPTGRTFCTEPKAKVIVLLLQRWVFSPFLLTPETDNIYA
jgi:hypothetical protein